MAQVSWTAQAHADLDAIHDLIARDSPHMAELFVRRLLESTRHLASFPQANHQLFFGKLFPTPVPLQNNQPGALDLLVSGEAMGAGEAFTSSADRGTLARSSRIDHLIVLTSAFRTTHKTWPTTTYSGREGSSTLNVVSSRNHLSMGGLWN